MDYIISTEYDGKRRKLYPSRCENCNEQFYVPKHINKRYCSIICRGAARKNRELVVCAFCGTSFEKRVSHKANSKSGLFFCSREHKDKAQRIGGISDIQPSHYNNGIGISRYRNIAFRNYENKCMVCGNDGIWNDKPLVLDVHHIDGNRENNAVENLRIVCPNCHRQEEMLKWGG